MAAILSFFADFPIELFIIQTLNGIVTGMILALIASGLTLIFGIMDVVNFAHGELFMLGAYVGVLVMAATGNFWLALVVATLVVALIGAAIQITTLRPLLGRDPASRAVVRAQSRRRRHQAVSRSLGWHRSWHSFRTSPSSCS